MDKDIERSAEKIGDELATMRLSDLIDRRSRRTRDLSTAEASKIFEGLMADDDDDPAIIDRLDDMNATLNAVRVSCDQNASQAVRLADDKARLQARYSAMVESRDQWRKACIGGLLAVAGVAGFFLLWWINRV